MITHIVAIVGGLVLLTLAADWLVAGAVALAHKMGVSPLFIGLTIVAAGTSTPELVVSVQASIENNPGIAVGSNIFNAALILGVAALIHPIACNKAVVKRDTPIMILVSLLCWWFASDRQFSRPESLIMIGLLVLYTAVSYVLGKKEATPEIPDEVKAIEPTSLGKDLGKIVIGLVGLVGGSKALLFGSVAIAKTFGVSDEIIGLTLIAAGTSLPELATSVVAAMKGQSEIAVGNVVGSNMFNILGILGVAGSMLPLTVSDHMLGIDIPLMVVVALGCLPIMWTGYRIVRAEGLLLVAAYLGYMYILFQTPS
ncbi:MAG TPA: calcium/sodium antiporter [Candidatus Ozemobacteraceae bacterium]|nr:calcium/sodium antiporter [Candidatus Ozemobacteraceae bacterium]